MEYTNKDRASLFNKIANIAGEIGAITRDKMNNSPNGRFPYASWEEVVGAVNRKLKEHHVAIIPSIQSWSSSPNSKSNPSNWRVELDVTIGDGETGYETVIKWVGAADTPSDKGLQAAVTNGMKYFYIKLFAIEVLDVDSDDDVHQQEQATTTSVPGMPNGSAPHQFVPQQPQPAAAPAERPTSPLAPPKQKTPEHANAESFLKSVAKMGLDGQAATVILARFGNKPNAQGKYYSPDKHDSLLAQLEAYVRLEKALRASDAETSPFEELEYLGINPPYTVDAVLTAIPLAEQHIAFSRAASAITKKAGQILYDSGLLPWRPEKQELMLQTLRNHVNPPITITETASVNEVAVGDFDNSLEQFANATGSF